MKQDKKDVWLKSLKESLGLFGLSDSTGDYIFDRIGYNKLRYFNSDMIAAAIFADRDRSRFREALETINQTDTIPGRITLAGYINRLSEKTKIVMDYDTFIYLRGTVPEKILGLLCGVNSSNFQSQNLIFKTALTLEEYLKYSLDLPPENSFMKSTNLQRLVQLVSMDYYLPKLESRKIYLDDVKKSLVFSSVPEKINPEIQKIHYLNYMKWAIAVASEWTYFSEIFDELTASQDLVEGILQVANLPQTLKSLGRDYISLEDLSILFYKAEKTIQFKSIEWETLLVSGSSNSRIALYALIDAVPFSVESQEGVMMCVNTANDYSPIIGTVEVFEREFMTEHDIQFLFFDHEDESEIIIGGLKILVPINKAIAVSGSVRVDAGDVKCLVVI